MGSKAFTFVCTLAAAAVVLAAVFFSRTGLLPSENEAASASGSTPIQAYGSERAETPQAELRYDREYPAVGYGSKPITNRVALLAERLERGEVALEFAGARGYLDDLLRALEIDAVSQTLVFSQTSVQVAGISPATPRAIYFNDDTYVAWVQGARTIEIASMDAELGPVFHTLAQAPSDSPAFGREIGRCLRCHDSYSLSGGGVPRFILGSGYIGTRGELVSHEGWIITSPKTALKNRWGGWYVTGQHGDQVHLGNIIVKDPADLQDLDALRVGNLVELDRLIDVAPYLAPTSDIVALLVLQHQVQVQNAIARAKFDVTTAIDNARTDSAASANLSNLIAEVAEPLVRDMLMVGDFGLTAPIAGTSGFRASFERQGARDGAGRSLRELNLVTRLFEYPLSYLIYSEAFDALPEPAKDYVNRRLVEVLSGQDRSADFDHLSRTDRLALVEILAATKPGFPALGAGDVQ